MFKRALNAILLLVFSMAALADLPGLGPAPRPVTALTMQKSGSNIVLNWSVTPAGTYDFYIYCGIAHPEYRAEVLMATITNGATTWTDTGAITRTRQGYAINEFYRVYAVPQNLGTALAGKTVDTEITHDVRNASLDMAYLLTNGDTLGNRPTFRVDTVEIPLAQLTQSKADLDVYNLPVVPEEVITKINPNESYPRKVTHAGYYAGAITDVPAADTTITLTIRQVPLPTVSRDGNAITATWTAITQDFAQTVTGIDLVRTHKGVGDGEPMETVATVAPNATQATDNISGVTDGWYCFWQLRLHYADGTMSTLGPSTEWVMK